VAAWTAACFSSDLSSRSLSAVAAQYVTLARDLDAIDPDFILDGKEPATGSARPSLELVLENARGLRAELSRLDIDEIEEPRRTFIDAQLAAVDRRVRLLRGQHTSIHEEAADFGLPIPMYDKARVDDVRRQLDAALPGDGPLVERLARDRTARAIGRARLQAAAEHAAAQCRARTERLGHPARGRIDFRFVIDRPWAGVSLYQGDESSIVEIRRDAMFSEPQLLALVCHESWPGHHVQHLIWNDLARRRGWIELEVIPAFSPHGIMAERAAVSAAALVVPRAEAPAVDRILDELAYSALAVAIAHSDGELNKTDAVERLRTALLMPDPESFLTFVARYRALAIAYVTPAPAIRDLQSYHELLVSPEAIVAGARR
jgi:hypothetical protein